MTPHHITAQWAASVYSYREHRTPLSIKIILHDSGLRYARASARMHGKACWCCFLLAGKHNPKHPPHSDIKCESGRVRSGTLGSLIRLDGAAGGRQSHGRVLMHANVYSFWGQVEPRTEPRQQQRWRKKKKEQSTERAGEGRKGGRTYDGSGERLFIVPRPAAAEAWMRSKSTWQRRQR